MEFHQSLVGDVVEGTDELIVFQSSRGQGQGYSKVKYLSELLLQAEAYRTHRHLGVEISI